MATYITKTQVSATDRKKFTFSAWIKRSKLSSGSQNIYESFYDANNRITLWINSSDQIRIWYPSSGSTAVELNSSQLLRDCNAWYHIVLTGDSTQSTQADRMKLYINGSRVTAWGTNTVNLSLNQNLDIGTTGYKHNISRYGTGSGDTFFGLMSHIHLTDGYAYDASAFGETDSTTGEWKIKTSPSVTYGNNGFFILKDGNSTTDHSGNSASFTTGGTLTKTEDNPSNVFATWNPLVNPWSGATTWTYGNTRGYNSDSHKGALVTTLGATSGKYYMEIKQENANGVWIGVCGDGFVSDNLLNKYSGSTQDATTGLLIKYSDGTRAVNNNDTNNVFETTGSGDITGIALDLDAATKTVTFYKNGSADSAGSQNLPTNMQTGAVFGCAIVSGGAAVNLNAGNGYFANNAISSAGTNASGIGIFEHDVPANHTALSTKGLNE